MSSYGGEVLNSLYELPSDRADGRVDVKTCLEEVEEDVQGLLEGGRISSVLLGLGWSCIGRAKDGLP